MKQMLRIDLAPLSTNHLYATYRNRRWLSKEGRAFKEGVEWAAAAAKVLPYPKGVMVDVTIIYHHAKPKRRIDSDNVCKCLIDGMTGVVFEDDRQVRDLTVRPRHNPEDPHLLVVVEEVE